MALIPELCDSVLRALQPSYAHMFGPRPKWVGEFGFTLFVLGCVLCRSVSEPRLFHPMTKGGITNSTWKSFYKHIWA